MDRNSLVEALHDKNDNLAYTLSKEISEKSEASDEFYDYFKDFLDLCSSEKTYVKTRGFILCCMQAKWDINGKLEKALPNMLKLLHDEKPSVVRQSLSALKNVVKYHPELNGLIENELCSIDLSGYKDNMIPLLIKDISSLRDAMMKS